jgi:monooxygenase
MGQLYDVLIIGAGLSGIGAAYHLQHKRPGCRYLILEAREDLGGTWDLFRYPGIRSDSDLFTFGYDFKPWRSDQAIADGPSIKAYLLETARENGIDQHIRYRQRVQSIDWSDEEQCWTAKVFDEGQGVWHEVKARWIFSGTGYYRYDQGYTPDFPGAADFQGRVIHPQHWPEDYDWSGQRVLVIGSGATAVTLLPALADKAAHVTMLQRTPTYILPVPAEDPVVRRLRPLLGDRMSYRVTRWVNINRQRLLYQLAQRYPNFTRRLIRKVNLKYLPPDYPVDVHFNPPYNPWDQRLCAVPGGDLYRSIGQGKASVVTAQIERFEADGIRLQNGEHLAADTIITATGLDLLAFGGIKVLMNGQPVDLNQTMAFKGMMLSGIPNLAYAVGYTASSWTLKVGLVCEHFCRLLAHMDERGYAVCTPQPEGEMQSRPLLDFGAGYVKRSLSLFPRQGDRFPWVAGWNYYADARMFRRGKVAHPELRFQPARPGSVRQDAVQGAAQ